MFRKTPKLKPSLVTSAATCSGELRRVIPAKVEPLDPATAGKLKRLERVEVNALHRRRAISNANWQSYPGPLRLARGPLFAHSGQGASAGTGGCAFLPGQKARLFVVR